MILWDSWESWRIWLSKSFFYAVLSCQIRSLVNPDIPGSLHTSRLLIFWLFLVDFWWFLAVLEESASHPSPSARCWLCCCVLFLFRLDDLLQRRVGLSYALQVPLAVTRLTVCRQPPVWQTGCSSDACSCSMHHIWIKGRINHQSSCLRSSWHPTFQIQRFTGEQILAWCRIW